MAASNKSNGKSSRPKAGQPRSRTAHPGNSKSPGMSGDRSGNSQNMGMPGNHSGYSQNMGMPGNRPGNPQNMGMSGNHPGYPQNMGMPGNRPGNPQNMGMPGGRPGAPQHPGMPPHPGSMNHAYTNGQNSQKQGLSGFGSPQNKPPGWNQYNQGMPGGPTPPPPPHRPADPVNHRPTYQQQKKKSSGILGALASAAGAIIAGSNLMSDLAEDLTDSIFGNDSQSAETETDAVTEETTAAAESEVPSGYTNEIPEDYPAICPYCGAATTGARRCEYCDCNLY